MRATLRFGLVWPSAVALWSLPAWRQAGSSATASGVGATTTRFGRSKVGAYVALTKPRIIELLLVTTVPTMIVAEQGLPSLWLIVATVVGGTLAAGGANAINMYVDRDIDRLMQRTQGRPLVTGAMTPRAALDLRHRARGGRLRRAVAPGEPAVGGAGPRRPRLFYVFVYTLWLKRTSTQNIVIGGAAGAVPVLVGWSAVTDSLGLGAGACCSP